MSSEEIRPPAPIAVSGLHAANHDEAEKASTDPQPATRRASKRLIASNKSRVAGTPRGIISYTDYLISFFGLFSAFIITHITHLSEKFSTRNASEKVKIEYKEDSIQFHYEKCESKSIKSYPRGWPELAAFMHSEDNFAIFRHFGLTRCRVILQLQAEIQLLEDKLAVLDQSDSEANPASPKARRLHITESKDVQDSEKRDLMIELREKLLQYDKLLLNEKKLRELGHTSREDHLHVFHWIMAKKPLGKGQYEWIYHRDDYISLSRPDPFASSILTSRFKCFFKDSDKNSESSIVKHYSDAKISIVAKTLTISLAVGILVIPVFILLWIPKTPACIFTTVLIAVLVFSTLICLFTKARAQEVLIGTAAYCAVLATFLGNPVGISA